VPGSVPGSVSAAEGVMPAVAMFGSIPPIIEHMFEGR
jgi:hypothetical protein